MQSADSAAAPKTVRAGSRAEALLLNATVFLSAFLLFLLEPMFAKMILPRFGGSAAVWATCLVFFQCALLTGYFYADVTSRRLPAAKQSYVHIALLAASLLLLPVAPHFSWAGGADPSWQILALLAGSIGLPFVLLSATSPLIQIWYSRRTAADPYHLFAVSNFASFAALLSFPILLEPRVALHRQALLWSAAFAGFVVLCIAAAWNARNPVQHLDASTTAETVQGGAPALSDKVLWLCASACGSMLLLSITNHLLENVAPVPLLWILPLALYLLTFTMAFHRRRLYSRWLMVRLTAVALGSLAYAIYDSSLTESLQVSVAFFCCGLFVCCLFCHGELALRRPAARHLTPYYLVIASGGAAGAIFVGLVAPRVFSGIYEFPLALVLTGVIAAALLWESGWIARAFWFAAAGALVLVMAQNVRSYQRNTVVRVRSFYGALRVKRAMNYLSQPYRVLYHGSIEHGAQFVNPPASLQPTTYYAEDSGIGFALENCCAGAKRVGVVGLGAGTLAAYGKAGDYFRFYEINPQIVAIAQNWFSYLRASPAKIDVILGDARLSLAREPAQNFDVLAVDAFSGDAIPVHLLTKEAFAIYMRHLKPDGILAIHTSNTYVELAPVVQLAATEARYATRLVTNNDNPRKLIDASDWVLITRNQGFLDVVDNSILVEPIDVPRTLRLWTDDYNNVFQILRPVTFRDAPLR